MGSLFIDFMKEENSSDAETYAIIGAAMEVHQELGQGFLEAVYQDALDVEFQLRDIPSLREQPIPVVYKTKPLNGVYRSDFVCFGAVIVELKATKGLTGIGSAQVLNYLKATGYKRALLINFGTPRLQYKRFVHGL